MPFVEASSRSPNGFYRAGKHWPAGGTVHELTPEQVLAVQAEPSLVVSSVANTHEELQERKSSASKIEADIRRQVEEAHAKRAEKPMEEPKNVKK